MRNVNRMLFGLLAALGVTHDPLAANSAQYRPPGNSSYFAISRECHDFTGLTPGAKYAVGDVIGAEHATISIRPYLIDGDVDTASVRQASVSNTKIAGGTSSQIDLHLVSAQVVPAEPVRRVTVKLAQFVGHEGRRGNVSLEVNGQRQDAADGFASANGKQIGMESTGAAAIGARMSKGDGDWQIGTLELRAVKGAIESFTVGAHTWRLDNLCFWK